MQDWQYWKDDQWGSHEFDPARFPDPAAWIREIHDRYHARLMISVWPKFYTTTENFRALKAKGFLYPETLKRPTKDWLGYVHTFYDAFNPEARKLFWEQMNEALFSKGVDAWWMDATEPELVGEAHAGRAQGRDAPDRARLRRAHGERVRARRTARRSTRASARADPDKRVFILTRSAFAGIQRYASATWSGDVSVGLGRACASQIPAGPQLRALRRPVVDHRRRRLRRAAQVVRAEPAARGRRGVARARHALVPVRDVLPAAARARPVPEPRDVVLRRDESHRAYTTQLAFDRLRYRMLPYAYSLAADVTRRHATIMRPLVMDFREDPEALGIGDQFLFGPSLLVSPVTAPGATARVPCYLPRGRGLVRLLDGRHSQGGPAHRRARALRVAARST